MCSVSDLHEHLTQTWLMKSLPGLWGFQSTVHCTESLQICSAGTQSPRHQYPPLQKQHEAYQTPDAALGISSTLHVSQANALSDAL